MGNPSPWPALGTTEVPTESLLHLSIVGGHPEILKLLLQDVEIFIDEKDSAGFTPLQRAVMAGRADMVAILLENGADVNGGDNCVRVSER